MCARVQTHVTGSVVPRITTAIVGIPIRVVRSAARGCEVRREVTLSLTANGNGQERQTRKLRVANLSEARKPSGKEHELTGRTHR